MAYAIRVAFVASLAAACSSPVDTDTLPPPVTNPAPFIVSNPVSNEPPAVAASASSVADDPVTYVSLPPGSDQSGTQATIRVQRTGHSLATAVVDGGFDPVTVPARAGDTIAVTLFRVVGASATVRFTVPARKPPVIVRTVPPKNKRDVPLNASMIVVFSEPIGAASLTPQNFDLRSGGTTVAGQITFANAEHTAVEFAPDSDLASASNYELVVRAGILDRDGTPLEAPTTVAFTTQTVAPLNLVFTAVSAGAQHACGVTTSGAAYCWGDNAWGQLGTGTTTASNMPVAVAGGISFRSISAAVSFTCGIATSGAGYCWGSNAEGLLGLGGTTGPETCQVENQVTPCSTIPRTVAGGLTFTSISAHGGAYLTFFETGVYTGVITQGFTCGVTSSAAAYCWGSSKHVWFASGNAAPVPMAADLSFASIATGMFRACGITTAGPAYCWGSNFWGGLGGGELFTYPVGPIPVSGGHAFSSLTMDTRNQSACGITTSGMGYCWGAIRTPTDPGAPECVYPEDGSITPCSITPLPIAGGHSWSSLSLGHFLSCGLTTAGTVYCWGLGRPALVPLEGGLTFSSVSTGATFACGLASTGVLYCWDKDFLTPEKVGGQP